MSQRKVGARRRGRSFKVELEEAIDQVINNSDCYEDFLIGMKAIGYEIKEGRYLSIKNEKTEDKYRENKGLHRWASKQNVYK